MMDKSIFASPGAIVHEVKASNRRCKPEGCSTIKERGNADLQSLYPRIQTGREQRRTRRLRRRTAAGLSRSADLDEAGYGVMEGRAEDEEATYPATVATPEMVGISPRRPLARPQRRREKHHLMEVAIVGCRGLGGTGEAEG